MIGNIIKKLRDDRGITIFVAYVLFLPIFLLSLLMLFELTKIQALKNTNEVITDISANAAVRQIDYSDYDGTTALILATSKTSFSHGDQYFTGHPTNTITTKYLLDNQGWINKMVFEEITSGGGGGGSGVNIEYYDELSAPALAKTLYVYNAINNGINPLGMGSDFNVDTALDDDITVEINNVPATYTDPVLPGETIYVNQPSVYIKSGFSYEVNPILRFTSGGIFETIHISSSSVAQIVTSASSDTDRNF